MEVKIEAQYRPTFSESQPKSKVPHKAPSANILPIHDASLEVNGCDKGESSD